mmetsp:Transcript_30724/g.117550  ORF Transcript_30724/g.117550 Transcript_30724/m.117550 type:complete len:89 (+) Transcript_30724:3401-3667(+)
MRAWRYSGTNCRASLNQSAILSLAEAPVAHFLESLLCASQETRKQDLLRKVVLPALSSSRRHQRLVEEFTVILDAFDTGKPKVETVPI